MPRFAKSKYSNIQTQIDGIKFDSRKEAKRYMELSLMLKAGIIKDLQLQPRFVILDGYTKGSRKVKAIEYVADFKYWDNEKQQWIIEDVKGLKTQVYQLKKKMFEARYTEMITEV